MGLSLRCEWISQTYLTSGQEAVSGGISANIPRTQKTSDTASPFISSLYWLDHGRSNFYQMQIIYETLGHSSLGVLSHLWCIKVIKLCMGLHIIRQCTGCIWPGNHSLDTSE